MSELIQKNDNRATIRWKLLTGVSALALTAYVSSGNLARAEDSDQPQVWIEFGGQLSRLQDGQEIFAPALMDARPTAATPSEKAGVDPADFAPSQKFEKPPLLSFDEQGKISFQADNSSWIFSAAIRYGRSLSNRHVHQQTYPAQFTFITPFYHGVAHPTIVAHRFADTRSRSTEQHTILDFQAGKDVGLGMFGRDGLSTVNFGVRFAQFRSNTNVAIKSNPDWGFSPKYFYGYKFYNQNYHSNAAELSAQRSFHGLGPSISWNASAPFAGNPQSGELAFDWGVSAALLFGKQKTRTHHQTTGRYHYASKYAPKAYRPITYQAPATPDHFRTKSVTVPNVGGFAGISFKYSDAKVSFGYKADFFFNAIDGGIDATKKENRAFYGPYASISIGLGD